MRGEQEAVGRVEFSEVTPESNASAVARTRGRCAECGETRRINTFTTESCVIIVWGVI